MKRAEQRSTDGHHPARLLDPILVIAVAGGVPLVLAARASRSSYRLLWGVPKYVTPADVWLGFLLLAVLLGAVLVGKRLRWRLWPSPRNDDRLVHRSRQAATVLLAIGLAGYSVLFAVASSRGFRLTSVPQIVSGDSGELRIAKGYLRPIGGLTTLNQLVGPGAGLAVFARRISGSWHRSHRAMLALGALACSLRSVVYAERLALLELLVPIVAVLYLARANGGPLGSVATAEAARGKPVTRVGSARLMLLALGGATFFAFQEFYRNWAPYYRDVYDGSFSEYLLDRVSGYYVTSVNNAAITRSVDEMPFGVISFRMLREAPFLAHLDWPGSGYDFAAVLRIHGNPEYNVFGGLIALWSDSPSLALLSLSTGGLLIGRLYSRSTEANNPAVVVYGCVLVGLLEISRVPYFALPRGVVPVVAASVACSYVLAGTSRPTMTPSETSQSCERART